MPAVNIVTDPSLDASKVAAAAHEAVKSGIGKPDMCTPRHSGLHLRAHVPHALCPS